MLEVKEVYKKNNLVMIQKNPLDEEFMERIKDPNFVIATSKDTFDASEQADYDYSIHMDELVKEILAYHQKDGLENFEEISMFVKKKISKLSISHKITERIPQTLIDFTEYEKNILKMIENKKQKSLNKIPNIMDDVLEKAKILEWGGVNLSKPVWYKLKLAMKKHMINENCLTLKFFGKIFGLNADYYIIYGKLKSYPFQKYSKKPHFEPNGLEGVNGYSFWVSNNFLEDWYQLPDIYPHQLAQSMLFKYYFTGDLKAKVKGFVPFDGTEAHLLKCQILRIMHACFIVPDGYLETKSIENSEETYGIDIGDKVTQVKEDFVFPTANEEFMSIEKWVHEFAYIFPNGKIIETNPEASQVPRMRSIGQDTRKLNYILLLILFLYNKKLWEKINLFGVQEKSEIKCLIIILMEAQCSILLLSLRIYDGVAFYVLRK